MTLFIGVLAADIITLGALFWLPAKVVLPWVRAIRERNDRRVEDVSGEAIPPHALVADAIRQLEGMGFERVGEAKTYLEFAEPVAWHMLSRDGTVMAELVEYRDRFAVAFSTMVGDDAVVETSCPIGERFKTRVHVSDFTHTGMQAAYDMHVRNLKAFVGSRLHPSEFERSMEAVLLHDAIYREKFYRRKLLRPLMRGVWLTLFLLIASVISLYVLWQLNVALRTSAESLAQVARQLAPLVAAGGVSLVGFFVMLRVFLYHAGQ
jgi:hypothetical protein